MCSAQRCWSQTDNRQPTDHHTETLGICSTCGKLNSMIINYGYVTSIEQSWSQTDNRQPTDYIQRLCATIGFFYFRLPKNE